MAITKIGMCVKFTDKMNDIIAGGVNDLAAMWDEESLSEAESYQLLHLIAYPHNHRITRSNKETIDFFFFNGYLTAYWEEDQS